MIPNHTILQDGMATEGLFATVALTEYFKGDHARIGRVTSLIFALGLVAIRLAADAGR